MYLTCKQFIEKYSWPPLGGLRHLIFYGDSNGFNKVIRRIGRRVLISEDEFVKWVEKNNSQPVIEGKI